MPPNPAKLVLRRAIDESSMLIDVSELRQVLSDALASFSPLAVLVGADSARAQAQNVSNIKQAWVAGMAPIGALGMMATVCKGAKLPGLKDLLGASNADINDACADLGCGTLYGIVPVMSEEGGLATHEKQTNKGKAACAILRASWVLGTTGNDGTKLDLATLCSLVRKFDASTVSGRVKWNTNNPQVRRDLAEYVVGNIIRPASWDEETQTINLFNALNNDERLKGGKGSVELHWPSPAMTLETNAWIILAYGGVFVAFTLAVIIVTTSNLLRWQSPAASACLLGGQFVLASGHVAAQWTLKHRRITRRMSLPRTGFSSTWALVDGASSPSIIARRPISHRPLAPHSFEIGQYYDMKPGNIPVWHALLTLATIAIGFIAFYVGAKSVHIYTLVIYIGLFLIANTTKGIVIAHANKADIGPLDTIRPSKIPTLRFNSVSAPLPSLPPARTRYSLCVKFAQRHGASPGLFYLSKENEWGMAAHAIYDACHHLVQWQPPTDSEIFFRMPIVHQDNEDFIFTSLIIVIDEARHEDLYWSVGQELVSIVVGGFSSTNLHFSTRGETRLRLLMIFVYTITKAIVSSNHAEHQEPLSGVKSMMRAIDLVRGRFPYNGSFDGPFDVAHLRKHAQLAMNTFPGHRDEVGPGYRWDL